MPGPIYNWFCVAHSIVDVLSNAAVIRASQVYPRTASAAVQRNLKRRTAQPVNLDEWEDGGFGSAVGITPSDALDRTKDAHIGVCKVSARFWDSSGSVGIPPTPERTVQQSFKPPPELTPTTPSSETPPTLLIDKLITETRESKPLPEPVRTEETSSDVPSTTDSAVNSSPNSPAEPEALPLTTDIPRSIPPSEVRQLTSSKIPSSRIGRLFHYGGRALHM